MAGDRRLSLAASYFKIFGLTSYTFNDAFTSFTEKRKTNQQEMEACESFLFYF